VPAEEIEIVPYDPGWPAYQPLDAPPPPDRPPPKELRPEEPKEPRPEENDRPGVGGGRRGVERSVTLR